MIIRYGSLTVVFGRKSTQMIILASDDVEHVNHVSTKENRKFMIEKSLQAYNPMESRRGPSQNQNQNRVVSEIPTPRRHPIRHPLRRPAAVGQPKGPGCHTIRRPATDATVSGRGRLGQGEAEAEARPQ